MQRTVYWILTTLVKFTYRIDVIWPVLVALDNNLDADVWTVLLEEFSEHLALHKSYGYWDWVSNLPRGGMAV